MKDTNKQVESSGDTKCLVRQLVMVVAVAVLVVAVALIVMMVVVVLMKTSINSFNFSL